MKKRVAQITVIFTHFIYIHTYIYIYIYIFIRKTKKGLLVEEV